MSFKKTVIFFFGFLFLAAPGAVGSDFPDRDIDVTDYELSLTIPFEKSGYYIHQNKLSGTARITLKNTGAEPLAKVPVILHRLMKAENITNQNGDPVSFSQTLRALEDNEVYQITYVEIDPETPISPGEAYTFEISYEGGLSGYQETGMLYVREALDPEFTIIRFETFAYPQILYPVDSQRRPAWNDAFNQVIRITVPDGHTVTNGANLTGMTKKDGFSTFEFKTGEPKSMILLPIAKYRIIESGNNRIYYFPEDQAGAEILAGATKKGMDLMAEWFGPLERERGLKVIEIPEWFGSQVDFPAIIQTADAFRDQSGLGQLYHELSHFWNVPDPDPAPARWNEGLAMFLQGLTAEKLDQEGALRSLLDRLFERFKGTIEDETYRVPMSDYGKHGITFLSYTGGGVFFGLLYFELGEQAFLETFDAFYKKYAGGATTSEFLKHLEGLDKPIVNQLIRDWFLTADYAELMVEANSFEDIQSHYLPNEAE
ncbi:MAG: hypothetical protein V3T82_07135 [Nitrospinaceae bacterium]